MKWVTLICLLLCTIVTESRHLHKRDAEHHTRLIGHMYLQVGKTNFEHLTMVMYAQNMQKCELGELLKMVQKVSTVAQHCVDHEEDKKCKKSMIGIFHDTICKDPLLEKRYPWSVECCAKAEPEREKCFHDHRDIEVEQYQRPDAEAACKVHKEHPEYAFSSYAYNIARRHSKMTPPAVLAIAGQYNAIVTECCAAEDKVKCFEVKFPEVKKNTLYIEMKQKHVCHVLSTFPDRVYMAIKIAKISQKHCNADLEVVQRLAAKSLHMSKDCCKGDVVECMAERMEYTQHICDNKEKLSPNLEACCEKPLLERTPCMIALPNDKPPADMPPLTTFIEDEHVCNNFAEHKDQYMSKILHECSKRHPDVSLTCLLRGVKGYEKKLPECCASDNHMECLKSAYEEFAAGIKECKDLVKQNCDAYKHLGPYGFNMMMLVNYIPKIPQAPNPTLLEITGKMTDIGGMCCARPESQRLPCAEDRLDLLIGEMCERQAHAFINVQARDCCDYSYADRRPCFTKLGLDPSYQPPEFDESAFQVGAKICEGSEQEQKEKRLTLLVQFFKVKPDLSKDKSKKIVEEFTKIREKCCAAENHQSCFDLERPAFLLHFKAAVGH